ncbi:hypothetical protein [Amycolatopsis keratiniphila]|uniref:Uncharacterized protein n=1 Tax=Amycolatopsis keratiniphila subsp. keratiniphila TaxID=227715 RepID=A0A1W2LYF6_9PSEU|nr:hypothetical protein [Amycolatopsis keratiniphila]OLZ58123.1 hypothetical protein BS330_12910 [Amycolatopsis keratiniphila subsp. nogabecina]ONF72171.1 hypothetical protein AVR91_0211600 [Amycolatopsis keratiniphila subsp. keratiniphila]SDU44279.1 hypothetical protein SAMN04489733_4320 [Amycolatopsis keratiniphila]
MTADVVTPQAEVSPAMGNPPKVRRLRDDADRSWAIADGHRTLAEEIETGGEPDAFTRAKSQRLLGEVAAHHGFAYHELANAAEARAAAKAHPRESPQWKLLIDRSFTAIRRAEAHHERAAAFSARTAGDEAAARRHELAAKEADRRAVESFTAAG